ncbi:MAG TPA: hypothetical protein VF607_01610, partial [Verrucomicrobiae bacterium]
LDGGSISAGTNLLTLAGDVSVTANSGTIYRPVSLGGGSRQFTVTPGGELDFFAPISNGSLVLNGGGFLWPSEANTYTGPTIVNQGVLGLTYADTFLPGNGGVVVNAGGTVDIFSVLNSLPVNVLNTTLTLNGGTVFADANPAGWSGPINVTADSALCSASSSLGIYGPITGTGNLLITSQSSNLEVAYYGSADNLNTGTTMITNRAHLVLARTGGATAMNGPVVVGNGQDPFHSAALELRQPNQINNSTPVTVNASGIFHVYNDDVIGSLTLSNGWVDGTNLLTLAGAVTNQGQSYLYCPLSLGGAVRRANISGALELYGALGDGGAPAGLVITGGGGIDFNTSNSFSGPLTVDQASWIGVYDNHALGSPSGILYLTNNAIMYLGGVSIFGKTACLDGGPVGTWPGGIVYVGTNLWTGPIQLLDTVAIADQSGYGNFMDVSGPISGPGGWSVSAFGTLRIGGTTTNTFSGGLACYAGTLELAKTNVPALVGPLAIGGGTVRLLNQNQIASSVEVDFDYYPSINPGVLDLNGFNDTVGDLRDPFGVGTVKLANSTLTVGGINSLNFYNGQLTGTGGYLV